MFHSEFLNYLVCLKISDKKIVGTWFFLFFISSSYFQYLRICAKLHSILISEAERPACQKKIVQKILHWIFSRIFMASIWQKGSRYWLRKFVFLNLSTLEMKWHKFTNIWKSITFIDWLTKHKNIKCKNSKWADRF
jgi:hypothetical protein